MRVETVSCISLPDLKKNNINKGHTKLLQILLTHYGYGLGTCDGLYGPKTDQAVQKFNNNNGIKCAYCNIKTWTTLLNK